MLWNNKPDGRIFISYRRSDAKGYAGRLSDSLEAYFGDNRVFRDIEDISGGADFGDTIKHNLHTADAVIVLIGPNWATTSGADGVQRLAVPNDWVCKELEVAIELGVPLFPVLIEDTPMPREDEIPAQLAPLLACNALGVSDKRWSFDVLRIGKILSFEIPSSNERKLDLVRIAISVMLFASLTLVASVVLRNFLAAPEKAFNDLLPVPIAAVPFVALATSTLLMAGIRNLIAADRKVFIDAAITVGALGCLVFFALKAYVDPEQEAVVTLFGAILTTTLMSGFMIVSGFKVK